MIEGLNGTAIILGLLVVVFLFSSWTAWQFRRSLPKQSANLINKIAALLSLISLCSLLWISWDFQPWMPAGRAVHLTTVRFGDCDFQIWQRKNASVSEPFSTGLFVRKEGGQWTAFLLDFEDLYRPKVRLQKEGSGIAVLYGITRWGHFDEVHLVLNRDSNENSSEVGGVVIESEPPDSWLLRPSSTVRARQ